MYILTSSLFTEFDNRTLVLKVCRSKRSVTLRTFSDLSILYVSDRIRKKSGWSDASCYAIRIKKLKGKIHVTRQAAFSLTMKYALLINFCYINPCLALHSCARSQNISPTSSLTREDASLTVIHLSSRCLTLPNVTDYIIKLV